MLKERAKPASLKPALHAAAASPAPLAAEETSQRAQAYASFTQQILSGGIRAGQFVTQRELTSLLDTPLGAVREMIPRLEAGGLVKTVPQRGLQVTPVDLKLIRNAFHGQLSSIQNLSKTNWTFITLSAVATAFSWIFYFRALQVGKVSLVAPIDKASLALTILLSVVFLGESLTVKTVLGAGLILAGVFTLIL